MFITRMRPYCRLSPIATSAYMPPVINPATVRSSHRPIELLPGRLGEECRGRRPVLRPDDLELALLPLAHDPRRRDVLAVLEADLADDRVELGARDVLAERLPVEPDLLHRLLEDRKARPCVGARPAIGLLLELGHVRVEVRLGRPAALRVPRAEP